MALDALEKDRLRRKMATRMDSFLEAGKVATCVSAHYTEEPTLCELCELPHAHEIFVVKNRSGKKMKAADSCLKEMVRFQVADVEDLGKWLEKMPTFRAEAAERRAQEIQAREAERRRLEKRVIVRRKSEPSA